jgi:hypothetical protein
VRRQRDLLGEEAGGGGSWGRAQTEKKNGENGLTSVGPDGRRERVRGGTAVVLRQTQFFSALHSF